MLKLGILVVGGGNGLRGCRLGRLGCRLGVRCGRPRARWHLLWMIVAAAVLVVDVVDVVAVVLHTVLALLGECRGRQD